MKINKINNDFLSFSESLKREIILHDWSKTEFDIFFNAFFRLCGEYKKDLIVIRTTHKELKEEILNLLKNKYKINPEISETKKLLIFSISDKKFLKNFLIEKGNLEIKTPDEIGAFIAGSFLAKGWMSNPVKTKFNHLEIRVKDSSNSVDIINAFKKLDIPIKISQKNKWLILYLKKSRKISDALKAMKATTALLIFEDQNIQREFVNSMNKVLNIEKYNMEKTLKASEKQIKILKKILNSPEIYYLKPNFMDLAHLRIDNPHSSLFNLALSYNEQHKTNYKKSTINNWLNEMIQLYEENRNSKLNF